MKPWGLAAACPGGLQERASNVWLSFLQPSGGGGGGAERGGIKNWRATAFLRPQEQMHKSPGPYPIP